MCSDNSFELSGSSDSHSYISFDSLYEKGLPPFLQEQYIIFFQIIDNGYHCTFFKNYMDD